MSTSVQKVLRIISAGMIAGMSAVIIEFSLAALIFSGDLSRFITRGVGIMLFGLVVFNVVVTVLSAYPGIISIPQELPVAILALSAAGISRAMEGFASPEEIFMTVIGALVVTTLATGILFLVLGWFDLGRLIRFIPYPVFGGFLGGTGYLLIVGAMGVMTDSHEINHWMTQDMLIKWLPGVLLGFLMLYARRQLEKFQAILFLLVGATLTFYLILSATGTGMAEAASQGWIIDSFTDEKLWDPISLADISLINWPVIASQATSLGTVLIISTIALLLHISALEHTARTYLDLNREMRAAGVANLFAAFGGSPVGYQTLGLTSLSVRMGSNTRFVGFIVAAMGVITLIMGQSLLGLFPKFILGGMIFFLGLEFLADWIYDAWFTLPRTDYVLMLIILGVVVGFGFLEGVFAGIFLALILFVINYSRVDIVKQSMSGSNYHSNVDRAIMHHRVISELGDQIFILKLQGFIFFGTANNLFDQVYDRLGNKELMGLHFIVLDFRLVTRLDVSAMNSFAKMQQLVEGNNVTIVFTNLSPKLHNMLKIGGFEIENDRVFRIFSDLDHGVEWCEDQLLISSSKTQKLDRDDTLPKMLESAFPKELNYKKLIGLMEKKNYKGGEYLIRQDSQPEEVYFVESGRVTAQLENKDGDSIRLRTMGAGTIVGEMSFLLGLPASASVVVERPSTIYSFTKKDLKKLEKKEPEMANAFHKMVTRLLGERLSNTTRTLRTLMD